MVKKVFFDWEWISTQIESIGEQLQAVNNVEFIAGIPRGGLIPAVLLSHKYGIPYIGLESAKKLPSDVKKKVIVVDDIADTGNTLTQIQQHGFLTATLVRRYSSTFIPDIVGDVICNDDWLVFPWERLNSKTIQDYLDK